MSFTLPNPGLTGIYNSVKAPGIGGVAAGAGVVADTRNFPYFSLWPESVPLIPFKILL